MRILVVCFILFPGALHAQALQKAKVLYEKGQPAEAAKLLEMVDEEGSGYAEAQYYLGRIAFDKKEYDDASDYFEEATAADDKNANYFEWLGNTYGLLARDANVVRQGFLAPKMKEAWEKAVALDAKNIGARLSLIEFYVQAPGFMGGSYDKARQTALQIMKLEPAKGHLSMGRILTSERNINEAEKEYQQAVKLNADYIYVLTDFYVNEKQYEKALAIYEEQARKDPANMITIYRFGRLSAISGLRLDTGEKYLKQYLTYTPKTNEPSHAGAYMRMGMIAEKRGGKPEAKKLYETALRLDKTMKEAEEGLVRVSK
jgi:tetratricopeptide (TPR) repeat protein